MLSPTLLRTAAGKVCTGISLKLDCGIGFCAEHSAIAAMLKYRETRRAADPGRAGGRPDGARSFRAIQYPHSQKVNPMN